MLVMVVFLSLPVFSQTYLFVEQYATTEKTDNRRTLPTTDMWFQRGLVGKVGVFSWAQTGPIYRQVYVGGSYQFTTWLQAGVGGGVEEANSKARLGSFAYLSKGKNSVFAIYENGGSGPWYFTLYNRKVGRYGLGVHTQSYVGTGPRAEVNFGRIKFWTSALWEKGGHNFMYGLRYTYSNE
jgi:hypothetical protein